MPRGKMQVGAGLDEASGQRLDPAVNHQRDPTRRGRGEQSGRRRRFGLIGRAPRVRPTQFVDHDTPVAHVELRELRRADVQHPAGADATFLGRDVISRKIDTGPRPVRLEPFAEFTQRDVLQNDLPLPCRALRFFRRGFVRRGPIFRLGVERQPADSALSAEVRGEPRREAALLADDDLQSGVAEDDRRRAVPPREDDLGFIHHDPPHAQPRGEPALARGFGLDGPTGRKRGPCRAGEQTGEERRRREGRAVVIGNISGWGRKTEARLQTGDAPKEKFTAQQRREIEREVEPPRGHGLAGRAQVVNGHFREPETQATPDRKATRSDLHLGPQPGFEFVFEHRHVSLARQKPAEPGECCQYQTADDRSRADQPPTPAWAAAVLRGGRDVGAT